MEDLCAAGGVVRPGQAGKRPSLVGRFTLLAVLMALGLALLTAGTCIRFGTRALEDQLTQDLEGLARLMGADSLPALMVGDPAGARQLLEALPSYPDVAEAAIFNAEGELFASYRRDRPLDPPPDGPLPAGTLWQADRLVTSQRITSGSELLGHIQLVARPRRLSRAAADGFWLAGAMVLLAGMGALGVSLGIRPLLCLPLERLTRVAVEIASVDPPAQPPFNPGELPRELEPLGRALGRLDTRMRVLTARLEELAHVHHTLQRSMGEMLIEVDQAFQITSVNQTVLDQTGYRKEELVGRSLSSLVEYGGEAHWTETVRTVGSAHCRELQLRIRDGGTIPVSFSASVMRGPVERILCLAHNRTAARRARQAERRYRDLYEGAHDLIVTFSRDGQGVFVNRACRETLGDLAGQSLAERLLPCCRAPFQECLERTLKGERAGRFEAVFLSDEGREVEVEGTLSGIQGDPGEPLSVLGIFRDVTDRKQAEEALRLSEERFHHAQKMEAVGLLASGVAHDFNNLLTAILASCDLLSLGVAAVGNGRSVAWVTDELAEIQKAAGRAASLTQQLLAFSRREMALPQVLQPEAVISEAAGMIRRLIGENIELVCVLEPGLGSIRAGPGQLEQVLMNLAVNARDAMADGGRLTVEARNLSLGEPITDGQVALAPGSYVVLQVRDTGCGMDPDTRARVFEPFFTTKGVGQGTGLGLSTVYGIVARWGGAVAVSSQVGVGTTFTVYLPHAAESPADSLLEPPSPEEGQETVLVVEDEAAVRRPCVKLLTGQGYTVLEAEGGDAALALAERHAAPIHLLITDVVMPGMSGRELAERLLPRRPEMRVLFMTGYTDDAILRCGLEQGRGVFLAKPFSRDTLLARVREVLHPAPGRVP